MAGPLASGRGLPNYGPGHVCVKTEARPGIYCPYSTSARPHLRTGKPPPCRERPGHSTGAGSAHWSPRMGRGRADEPRYSSTVRGSPRVGPGPAVPNLDREPHNSPKGPRDRLPPFYHYPPTPASRRPPHARRCKDGHPRAQGRPVGDFRRVSRDTRATSRNDVLDPFKASQKYRLFGGKSRPFPALTPQTQKHPAGGSIPPISTTKTA